MSLDTKVKNLIINTNMTKEQYEAVADKSNQLFFVEDSSVADVPAPPTDNGTYVLRATVVDGVVTTEWVSEA